MVVVVTLTTQLGNTMISDLVFSLFLFLFLTTLHLKKIPISINNSLPSIYLNIGLIMENENKTRMIVDTSATMNTGNKDYHLWVMSQCLSMIADYLECGADTEYDVIRLLAALDLKGTHQHVDRGSTTAVIRYRIISFINNT